MLLAPIYLRSAEESCYSCGEITQVFCVAAKGVVDEEVEDGHISRELYESNDGPIRISNLESIDPRVDALLKLQAPNYRMALSKTQSATVYMNHCDHCGAKQGDFYLHNEPDGPFFGHPDLSAPTTDVLLCATGEFTFEGDFHP